MIKKKLLRVLYYHDCKSMECRVIKDNKEQCKFCKTKKWKIYLKIYKEEEKKPSLIEKLLNRPIGETM